MATASEHIGRRQVMLLLLLGCNYIIVGINHTLATFQGYTPAFFCRVIYGDGSLSVLSVDVNINV
jgi:hypothetical protein